MSRRRITNVGDGAESVASDDFDDHLAGATSNGADLERTTLARKEDIAVQWMRAAVFLVLMGTAALVSSGVYVVTRRDQVKDFEDAFAADADKVLTTFNKAVERRLEAIDALSLSITAYARDTGSTFPNVTISDFEIRCANIRVLSDTPVIQYHPIVTEETRAGWNAYQIANRDRNFDVAFASEVAMIALQDASLQDRKLQGAAAPVVLNDDIVILAPNGTTVVAPPGSGPYLPIWQLSPVLPTKSLLNNNILWNPISSGSYTETMKTGQAVIDIASNLNGENLGKTGFFWKLMLDMSQYRGNVDVYLGDPVAAFGYPVFDSFNLTNRKVVALLGSSMYWGQLFKNSVPKNTRGIICVLQNTKGQSFSYRIDENVTYLGPGNLHEPKYRDFNQSSTISKYIGSIKSPETKSYTSVELNSEYNDYTLYVYPSQANQDVYVTNGPAVMTVIVICVFFFASLVFAMYTVAVGRRQTIVMNRAVASSAIVSSLFPSQVRDQIYQETTVPQSTPSKAWLKRDGATETLEDPTGRPIAELFENTTIMFADMVGFTKWSSIREPVQVFELLETLYKAFDTIAVRRKVFKVETIGDCYVAVAGLPDPQEDHALIMVKFADDCMSKMRQLTAELALVLGADTAELAMRVGLHSGSVTGGVLRGQKSRFQLFGDTMNTASRMESNGMAGRIHASQETVAELIAKGKLAWVTPREDKILAKGKGELQTYWVTPRGNTGSVVSAVQSGSDEAEAEAEAKAIRTRIETVEL